MLSLDHRQIEILRLLVKSKQPISVKAISQRLNITPRIVRYHLRGVDEWLNGNNTPLTRLPGLGIALDISESEKINLEKKLDRQNLPGLSSKNRHHVILLNLFFERDAVAVKQLQNQLGASRTTIINDLQKVSEWLEYFQIQLVKRQNFGCFIQGSEANIRQAIISLLVESINETKLLTILGNLGEVSISQVLSNDIDAVFIQYLNTLELKFFCNIVDQIQTITHRKYTDRAYMILALQIAISVDRMKNGANVEIAPAEIELLRAKPDFHLSVTIIEIIRRQFGIKISESEIAYLLAHILDADLKRPLFNSALIQDMSIDYGEDVHVAVDILLDHAALYLHPALRLDEDLKNNLYAHISNILDTPPGNKPMPDPLLEDVKCIYPEVYKVAHNCLVQIDVKTGAKLASDEVGYITMYLVAAMERLRMLSKNKKKALIVCNSGVATSRLLVSRVVAEFPEIDVSGVMSYLEYKKNKNVGDYDLIITAIPIPLWDKPAIVVSPLLDRDDVTRIRSLLNNYDQAGTEQYHGPVIPSKQAALSDLLTKDSVDLQIDAQTWQDVIDSAGNLLVKIGGVKPGYINAMKQIREDFGPYMVIMPGIAILHAFPEDGVNHLCMSMVTIKNPVEFGNKKFDPVFLAFALGTLDNQMHLRALSELIDMVKDEHVIQTLRNTCLKARALNLIARVSQGQDIRTPKTVTQLSKPG